jgi:formate dehydrogenase gamma subunit
MSKEESIRRFSPYRIAEHWLNAVVFVVLAVTGLAQKFHHLEASQWIILALGGIDATRLVHRLMGLALVLITVQHIVVAFVGVVWFRWRPSMLITKKDFRDLVENLKYYLGLRGRPALCDRYTYKQKFEYWAVLTAQCIMAATGLMLWFPITTTDIFSGELIPLAKILHTNEAMVVLLIVALWHIYNSMFSPQVFPLDTTIIIGRISRERMLQEHPLELARLEGLSLEQLLQEQEAPATAQQQEA